MHTRRLLTLDGRLMEMVSEVMYLLHSTSPLSFYPSKEPHYLAVRPQRKTKSTIIVFSAGELSPFGRIYEIHKPLHSCCGRVDWSWRLNQVCDCYSGGSKCDNSCLHAALLEDSVFYNSGIVRIIPKYERIYLMRCHPGTFQ